MRDCMQYDLSAEEARHIEKYRDLLPEFQTALNKQLNKQLQALFELQTQIMQETFESMK